MTSVEEHIATLVARICGVEASSVRRDRALIEYGLDSVRAVDLVLELEGAFELQIPDEDVLNLSTVRQVAEYVARRTLERAPVTPASAPDQRIEP